MLRTRSWRALKMSRGVAWRGKVGAGGGVYIRDKTSKVNEWFCVSMAGSITVWTIVRWVNGPLFLLFRDVMPRENWVNATRGVAPSLPPPPPPHPTIDRSRNFPINFCSRTRAQFFSIEEEKKNEKKRKKEKQSWRNVKIKLKEG